MVLQVRKVVTGMRDYRKAALLLAAAIAASAAGPMTAMAAGPLSDRIGSGYDEETWAKLTDNVLEFDEVPLLIHEFNPSLKEQREKLEEMQDTLNANADELESHQRKMEQLKDSATADMDMTGIVQYATQEQILKYAASGMRTSAKSMLSRQSVRSMQKGEDQLTQAVQSLMIQHGSLNKQVEILRKVEELGEKQCQMMTNMQSQGLVTTKEVLDAQNSLLSTQGNIHKLESALINMKSILCTLTGWPADADPEIAPIPSVDLGRIETMNLEEDTRRAIGNNPQLIEQRHSNPGKTNAGIEARLDAINEGDQQMTIKMQELYDDVMIKKTAYEGAKAGYEAAQKTAASQERMYQMGMLSQVQYLGGQVSTYQKQAAYESADMNLRLAMDTYKWAAEGMITLD